MPRAGTLTTGLWKTCDLPLGPVFGLPARPFRRIVAENGAGSAAALEMSTFKPLALFVSGYALRDASLEIAARGERRPWHTVMAASFAGVLPALAASQPAYRGAALGAALGAGALPLLWGTEAGRTALSMLQLVCKAAGKPLPYTRHGDEPPPADSVPPQPQS
jgi:hypothetical protein